MYELSGYQRARAGFKIAGGLSVCLLAILPINISFAEFEAFPTGEVSLGGTKHGGVAWGDFNNDSCLDILVAAGNVQLFQQNKDEGRCLGNFEAVRTFVSPNTGLRSVIWGDFDNDGFIDFAVNKFNQLVIYKNVDGTAASFVEVLNDNPGNSEGMGWFDYDADGYLDLLVQNQGVGTYLYNNDNGVFTASIIHSGNVAGDYLAVTDFDVDGDVDAYIRRDGMIDNDAQSDLYINDGNGIFSLNNTINENSPNNNKGSVVFCDFDNDGDFDLARTDGGQQGIFEQINGEFSLKTEILGSHESIACEDVNNDGLIDLFLSNSANILYLNDGDFAFTRNNLNISTGGEGQSKGVAFADYDRDGDMDLLINKNNAPTELWNNLQNDKNYLQVQLITNNRDALGATVRLFDADTNEAASGVREINGGMGWGSQGAPFAHFGGIDPEKSYIARVKFVGGETADHTVVPAELCDYQLLSINSDGSNNLRECIADSDGDGIKNDVDIDDDNDGITDVIEGDGAVDTDNDGVPDSLDLDTDNDGLYDFTESGADLSLDTDNDGRINGGVGNNGLPDSVETAPESGLANYNGGQPVDTDLDNVADFRDLDSDDDGINDVTEAGGSDPDNDGIIGEGVATVDKDGLAPGAGLEYNDDVLVPEKIADADGDGIKDDDDLDDDNDGITDAIEGNGTVDTDGDLIPDSLDLDSDNDGLYDALESGAGVALTAGRVDGAVGTNGLADVVETAVDSGVLAYNSGQPVDTDLDNVADFRDLDSDNDGITDVIEAGGKDLDADGILDNGAATVDEDGLIPGAGLTPANSDQDMTPDYRDLDSDNDGLSDIIEAGFSDSDDDGMIDAFSDSDGNGFDDNSIMPLLADLPDNDADGLTDFRDNDDADNDGVSDYMDMDDDNDGIPDALEGDGAVDTDGDLIPDSLDLDSDNDGLYDALESGAGVALVNGRVEGAVSSNGLPDAVEAGIETGIPAYNNGSPLDTDGDEVPDFRDLDSDNDGITDVIEAGAKDPDNNAFIGSGSPPAVNPDGLAVGAGVMPLDTDGDKVPDYRDLDSDNDGIPDVREAGGSDNSADLSLGEIKDINKDGLDDLVALNPLPVPDTDRDTLPDYRDLDSENDGIPDVREGGAVDRDIDANDGRIYQFEDNDGDGLDDGVASLPLTVPDTDGDGVLDYLDYDTDGDGLNDLVEGGGIDVDNNGIVDDFTDTNARDGYDDRLANNRLILPDTDDDGIHDFRDAKKRIVVVPPSPSELETGLNGVGAMGPLLPLLLIVSLFSLVMRRTLQPKNVKVLSVSVLAVVLGSGTLWTTPASASAIGLDLPAQQNSDKNIIEWQSRWYAGLGIGLSNLEPGSNGTAYSIEDKRSQGGRVYIGYDLFKRLSLEGYYSDLGEAKIAPNGTIEYQDVGLSALYYLYKQGLNHEGFGLFGKMGAGRMRNQSDLPFNRLKDYHLLWGGGIEYAFENGFALRGDFDFYDKDSQFITISLMKRFGDIKKPVPIVEPEPLPVTAEVKDSDGDGVIDEKDKCPDTVAGAVVDINGCEIDSDKDGVVDRLDQCPDTPLGTPVDAVGCPLDSDDDGVIDAKDRCPDTRAGAKVDEYGCEIKEIIVLSGVYFDTNEAILTDKAQHILSGVADILFKHPELAVSVIGHTDNRKSHAYNQKLSELRADSVRDYLVDHGIASERLFIKGFSYDQPVADNSTPEGRAANRRVELHIMEQ